MSLLTYGYFPFKRRIKHLVYKAREILLKPWKDRQRRKELLENPINNVHYELNSTKRQREEHAKDLLQPYNSDGTLNKEFKKVYPNSEFVRRHIGK
jgi:hypothetical protein